MPTKITLIFFCLALAACSAVKTVDEKGKPLPLARKYQSGEKNKYKMKLDYFENGKRKYSAESLAEVKVSTNAAGTFYEEFRWKSFTRDGKKVKLDAAARNFRLNLSLEPSYTISIPADLAKVWTLVQPITDTMAFYVDMQLAIKKAMALKPGERLDIRHGEPNSWAGGPYKVGCDCVDFELTLTKLGRDYGVLNARHVPPGRVCGTPPALWMEKAMDGSFPNWYQVRSLGDGNYAAGYATEIFENEIKFSLKDGRILSATQDNTVKGQVSYCLDPGLVNCGAPGKIDIRRKIVFSAD